MKLYLPILAFITLISFAQQVVTCKRLEPTSESFVNVQDETGTLKYEKFGIGRAPSSPTVNGTAIWCGVTFDGPVDPCESKIRSLRAGSKISFKYVDINTTNGPIRVALSVTTDGDESYVTTPKKIISDWRSSAWISYFFRILEIFVFLLLFPVGISQKIREML